MPKTETLVKIAATLIATLDQTTGSIADSDDIGMLEANSDDILSWVDDMEDRLGFDVAELRSIAIDYCTVRDDGPEALEVIELWEEK